MSVVTEADEKYAQAILALEDAIFALAHIVINRCWGYDDYSKEFQAKLRAALNTIMDVRDAIE